MTIFTKLLLNSDERFQEKILKVFLTHKFTINHTPGGHVFMIQIRFNFFVESQLVNISTRLFSILIIGFREDV